MKTFVIIPLALVFMGILGLAAVKGAPVDNLVVGKFQLESPPGAADYAEYLKGMQVSEQYQQVLSKMPINLEIVRDPATSGYKYKVITPFLTREVGFELGKEITDQYVDGRPFTATFELEGDNVIHQILKFEDFSSSNKYTFGQEKHEVELSVKGHTAKRLYKRVEEFTKQ